MEGAVETLTVGLEEALKGQGDIWCTAQARRYTHTHTHTPYTYEPLVIANKARAASRVIC